MSPTAAMGPGRGRMKYFRAHGPLFCLALFMCRDRMQVKRICVRFPKISSVEGFFLFFTILSLLVAYSLIEFSGDMQGHFRLDSLVEATQCHERRITSIDHLKRKISK